MYNVLIVEDDPMVAMINNQYVSRNKNFHVASICKNGQEALDYLEEHSVDLIILDLYMPKLNGFDTLRQIRKQQIPLDVIMVTAANDRHSLEEALHLGVIDYLIKPFTFDRFQIALEKFISKHDALNHFDTLTQKNVDFIIEHSLKKNESLLPKGIQEKTLKLILHHLNNHPEVWVTGEDIAKETKLTSVTVRRYMNYLVESGKISGEMNYETGGRPCMRYRPSDHTKP